MAIRGVSLAEREEVVLPTDPAHEDNIKADVASRLMGIKDPTEAQKQEAYEAARRDAGDPTVFIISPLTYDDKIELGDLGGTMTQGQDGMRMSLKATERMYMTVQRSLKGWRNFTKPTGEPIPFSMDTVAVRGQPRSVASAASVAALNKEDIGALARIINEKNGLRTDIEKKLEGLSTPSVVIDGGNSNAPTSPAPQTSGENVVVDSPQN